LKIDPTSIFLVTDGQLPLRQCLHPESSAKEVYLPSYYWKFSDLKKEYMYLKSSDLSRTIIPVVDAMKLPNMPAVSSSTVMFSDIMIGRLRSLHAFRFISVDVMHSSTKLKIFLQKIIVM
jgi:epithelial splicing regulatory protein 1/2